MRLKAVDAFCGAGGLSLGLQRAGFDVVYGFDSDPTCIETIRKNRKMISHPVDVRDIRDMLGGELLRRAGLKSGELDLLAGGPPCQGFSAQRTIGPDEDPRNSLVDSYGELVLEVMPRFFLMENVPGITNRRGAGLLSKLKGRLESAGYLLHESVLDAQNYRVPQRRKRYVLVGERAELKDSRFEWPRPQSRRGGTVRSAIGNLPAPPKDGSAHSIHPNHRADRVSTKNLARLAALAEGESMQNLPRHLLADCHISGPDVVGHRNVYGRMHWDDVAPTITARFDSFTRGKFGHPEQMRTISLLEGALIQTFPQDYVFSGTKTEVARQIGNAVPPRFAAALGTAVAKAALRSK